MDNEEPKVGRRIVLAVRGLLYQVSAGGVLLLRRHSNEHYSPGMWELPGGKFDESSMSMDQAVEREFGEETGIPIVATQPPISVWDKPAGLPPKYPGDVLYQCTVLRVHLVFPEIREPILSNEHDDFQWIEPKPENLMPFGDYLPKETRDALEIFYQYNIFFPRLMRSSKLS